MRPSIAIPISISMMLSLASRARGQADPEAIEPASPEHAPAEPAQPQEHGLEEQEPRRQERGSQEHGPQGSQEPGPRGLQQHGPQGPQEYGPQGPQEYGPQEHGPQGPQERGPQGLQEHGSQEHGPQALHENGSQGPQEPAEPAARPGHVGELAGQTRVALQRARALYHVDNDILDIERALPRAERDLERLRDPARSAPIARLSQREIADLRQQWRVRRAQYEEWQAMLNEVAGELESTRSEIVSLRRSWSELHDLAEQAGVSERRMSRIVASHLAVREADAHIDERLEQVLELQERVSELGIAVEDELDQLRAAAAAYRDRLFVRDRPPIWQGLEAGAPEDPVEGPSFAERTIASLEAAARREAGLARIVAVLLAALAIFTTLGRRSRLWPADDRALDVARAVASRPIAAALFWTALATPFLMQNAPIVLYDVVFLALLAPLVWLLLPLSPPHVRPMLVLSGVLLVVNRLEAMLAEDAALARALLLAEATVAILGSAAWLWRERGRDDATTRRIRIVVAAAGASCAIALIANAIGYVLLAKTLLRGTGFSASSGLSLLASLLIAQALLDLALRSGGGQHLHTVRGHGELIRRRAVSILVGGVAIAWLVATLAGYGLWTPLEGWLDDRMEERWTVGSLDVAIGDVAIAIGILVSTIALARLARFVLEIEILPRMQLEPGVDGAISGLTRYILVSIGILLALAAVGIDAGQIAIVAGALGVGVGFGLQGIVANVIAGLVLMLERPVRLGDFIQAGPLTGKVERIGLRSSTVRAGDGSEVIVPNESLISREVVNWTLSDRRRRVQVNVGVAYGTDPRRVLEILQRVAASQAGVLGGPAPEAFFVGFGASSLDFVLQFWTDDIPRASALQSQVGLAVHDALASENIEVPFPQLDVHLRPPQATPDPIGSRSQ